MKVGDYVRTKGIIRKIDKIGYQDDTYISFTEDNTTLVDKSIIKSSPNIIDLIEVGDYVNGKKVIDKWEEPDWYDYFIKLEGEDTVPTMRKIESVVTKEQFESMQYKVDG